MVQKAGNGVETNLPFGAVKVPRGLVGPSPGLRYPDWAHSSDTCWEGQFVIRSLDVFRL